MSLTRVAPNVRFVEVLYGDSLQRISLRELGDASKWVDIAILNGLKPPYTAKEAAAGVAGYGDSIKVPAPLSSSSHESDPDAVFGVDILLSDKKLRASNGDLVPVVGVSNFLQAIRHRVTVEKRELAFHPTYGCWVKSLVGVSNSVRSGQLAAFYVKSAIVEDSRVDSVPSCTADISGDLIFVEADTVPVSGRPVDMKVTI